jgi:hypothetical protein
VNLLENAGVYDYGNAASDHTVVHEDQESANDMFLTYNRQKGMVIPCKMEAKLQLWKVERKIAGSSRRDGGFNYSVPNFDELKRA